MMERNDRLFRAIDIARDKDKDEETYVVVDLDTHIVNPHEFYIATKAMPA